MAAFGDGVRQALGKVRDIPAASHTADAVKQGANAAAERARAASGALGRSVNRGVGTVTLREHREETQAALAEIVEVLSAHEAEIAGLRARLDELEAERAHD